jgi:hypothetical protein
MRKIVIKYPSISEEPQSEAIEQLMALSKKLQDLLPDPSLSPLERVERLGRVIPDSIQRSSEHLTARSKLNNIRLRLAELVPDEDLTSEQRIDYLVDLAHKLIPKETSRFFEKLEIIGDNRSRDNGSIPYHGWSEYYRELQHLKDVK